MRIFFNICAYGMIYIVLMSCEGNSVKREEVMALSEDIQNEVSILTDTVLGRRDSCLLLNFISDSATQQNRFVVLNNSVSISHFTCPDNNFSFVVFTDMKSQKAHAYPLNDIFALRNSRVATDSMRLKKINPNVPNLGGFWNVNGQLSDNELSIHLEKLIGEFYVEKIGNRYTPILSSIYPDDLQNVLSPKTIKELEVLSDNKLMFLDKYFGILVFQWIRTGASTITLSEYIIPFRKYRNFRLDVPTQYSEKCNIPAE